MNRCYYQIKSIIFIFTLSQSRFLNTLNIHIEQARGDNALFNLVFANGV